VLGGVNVLLSGLLGFLLESVQDMDRVLELCNIDHPVLSLLLYSDFPHTLPNGGHGFPVGGIIATLYPIQLVPGLTLGGRLNIANLIKRSAVKLYFLHF
jgi:hypothetical protein